MLHCHWLRNTFLNGVLHSDSCGPRRKLLAPNLLWMGVNRTATGTIQSEKRTCEFEDALEIAMDPICVSHFWVQLLMGVSNFFYIRTHYHLHLLFEFDSLGCMNNASCLNSATFILHFTKLKVYITYMVYLIFLFSFLLCMHLYLYFPHHSSYSTIMKYMLAI